MRKDLLNELMGLISIPEKRVKSMLKRYGDEDREDIVDTLFAISKKMKLTHLQKKNLLSLIRFFIKTLSFYIDEIPFWLIQQIDSFIKNPSFNDTEKLFVVSAIPPEIVTETIPSASGLVERYSRGKTIDFIEMVRTQKPEEVYNTYKEALERI